MFELKEDELKAFVESEFGEIKYCYIQKIRVNASMEFTVGQQNIDEYHTFMYSIKDIY